MKHLVIALLFCFLASSVLAQAAKDDSMKNCPMHQHEALSHDAIVEKHGDQAMEFPHDKTTHHFGLAADGGVIQVTVNDADDRVNMDAIRSHLSRIAVMFANGDFSAPMFTHDGIPPGITTMKLLKSGIHYIYEETGMGGTVHIQSADPVAVAAIHDFLRFQIAEHHTGDSLDLVRK